MIGTVKTGLKPLLAKAIRHAGTILKDDKELNNLVGSASLKLNSFGTKMKSGKDDAVTLLDMIKAWVSGEYTEVPRTTILLGIGALIYFVNPFDAIPDLLPATGLLDDVTVIGLVLASIREDVERFRAWRSCRSTAFNTPDAVSA